MSSLSHLMILTSDTAETNDDLRAPMLAVNAWCDEHANGQRFELLPTDKAGGHKVWCEAVWACCGNYFPIREFMQAFPTFGWSSYTADTTILLIRGESVHSGDAWIAIDGHGGAITKEPDLGYGRAERDPSRVRFKLFHWDYLDAIEDWGPGNAAAMAETKEEAIQLIVMSCNDNPTIQARLRAELIATDPVIYDEPAGFTIMGSA